MIIKLKNKDTLICDDFQFKCSIGKNGLKKNKLEGDNCTPIGTFSLGPVYYRNDRLDKPNTKLKTIRINNLEIHCIVYVASKNEIGKPREGYLEKVMYGAWHFDFGDKYDSYLQSLK